ncbi:alpha/beta hydrolase [Uliginosibacterium sp. sgz301328]|uniref:alpha/beta hydrolase n=1 Tax=Uliginosibacterium sp. sgz301328 TaxID=3243764 RepID=UPI00359CBE70
MSKTIILIHGAWLTPASWTRFRERYEAQGYRVLAPAWPLMERPVTQLRSMPDAGLASLGINDIVARYERLVRMQAEAPILIGHSFGGLFVQLLLDRGLGAAGVAISPAPPFGVLPAPRAVWSSRCVFAHLNGWHRAATMGYWSFAQDFAQTLPEPDKPAAYYAHIVPAPGRIFFEAALGVHTAVAFDNPVRPPLLLIGAEYDRTVTPSMVRANFRKQYRAGTPTAFHEFADRSHWLCNETGWQAVADLALHWSVGKARNDMPAVRETAADDLPMPLPA